MKCGDCLSQGYAECLFVWAGIKLPGALCRSVKGNEDLSPAGDVVVRRGKPEVDKKSRAVPVMFQCHSRNIKTKSNDLCQASRPPVICHTSCTHIVRERV